MKTFQEFKDSFVRRDAATSETMLGQDFNHDVMINDDFMYIETTTRAGWFHVIIERSEYCGPFEVCARILYQDFYIPEKLHSVESREQLDILSQGFMDSFSDFTPMSLDEWVMEYGDRMGRFQRQTANKILGEYSEYGGDF